MRKPDHDRSIHRVLVILDVTSDHAAALEAATAVAVRLDVPLVVLFAENEQLDVLEHHPLVRAIDLPTGTMRMLTPGTMRRGWRALVRRTQRQLAHLSQRHQIEVGFELVRGDVTAQLGERIRGADLLVIESTGRNITRHVRVEPRGRFLVRKMSIPVLFVGAKAGRLQSIALLYNRSNEAQRGLEMALRMGAERPIMLTVILASNMRQDVRALEQWVTKRARESGSSIRLHIRRITCCETSELLSVASHIHADLVIVPAAKTYPGDRDVQRLTRRLDCPLLVLRGDRDEGDQVVSHKAAVEG